MPLTANDVKTKTFPTMGNRLVGEWYDSDAVDEFLLDVQWTIDLLQEANIRTMRQLMLLKPDVDWASELTNHA